ncbi:MAG: DUF819 family protein [Saprospiraceae bacterium]|nr:DUF819 family protein [Saprospiraceae bacterium]
MKTAIFITLITVTFVKWIDSRQEKWIKTILDWFPAILFAYVIPAVVCYTGGMDLSGVELHGWSKNIIMPLAILTVMSALSFRQLKMIGWKPIAVFVSGSAIIALMPVFIGWGLKWFYPSLFASVFEEGYWRGWVTMVGSWIGGSTSQLVLKEIAQCPEGLFVTILVMDNVMVNIWTLLMFQFIKKSDGWNNFFGIKDKVVDFVPDHISEDGGLRENLLTGSIVIVTLIFSIVFIEPFLAKILILSVIGLLFGNLFKWWNHTLVLRAGGILIITIMAILGLKLKFEGFAIPLSIIGLSIFWLISHYVVMILVAWKLNLHMAWIPIASMANVGGISTAPAVTSAYNEEWMPHAIILAILSMVSGTTWGLLTVWLIETWIV